MIITNLLTNMVVLTFSGSIPTNTIAFQQLTSDFLLTNAQAVAARLHLEGSLIQRDRITHFEAIPGPNGPTASVLFEKRYLFKTLDGSCLSFSDEANFSRAIFPNLTGTSDMKRIVEGTHAIYKRLWLSTNRLTLMQARQIAESSMRAFGVGPEGLKGFKTPVKAEQMKWRDDVITHFEPDGTAVNEKKQNPVDYALPYYNFRWETKAGAPHAACDVEVSGITGNVVFFHFAGPRVLKQPRSNYLENLGLSANTIFVKRRSLQPATYETVE